MKIDKVKIRSEYRVSLKDFHREINTLSSEDMVKAINCAKNYYSYLVSK